MLGSDEAEALLMGYKEASTRQSRQATGSTTYVGRPGPARAAEPPGGGGPSAAVSSSPPRRGVGPVGGHAAPGPTFRSLWGPGSGAGASRAKRARLARTGEEGTSSPPLGSLGLVPTTSSRRSSAAASAAESAAATAAGFQTPPRGVSYIDLLSVRMRMQQNAGRAGRDGAPRTVAMEASVVPPLAQGREAAAPVDLEAPPLGPQSPDADQILSRIAWPGSASVESSNAPSRLRTGLGMDLGNREYS